MPLNSQNAAVAIEREADRPRKPHNAQDRPVPEGVRDVDRRFSVAQRSQCLTMLALKVPRKQIRDLLGISEATQSNILKKARDQGYDPAVDMRVLQHYVEDGTRSGRPREIGDDIKHQIVETIESSYAGRAKTADVLAYEAGISVSSVLRILHDAGLKVVKPTTKPGLSSEQRATRLKFCKEHEHWTLDDWKKVIFTDETSVILGVRRGGIRL